MHTFDPWDKHTSQSAQHASLQLDLNMQSIVIASFSLCEQNSTEIFFS